MPVLDTKEAKEIKALTKKQQNSAYRRFALVQGLPAPPKGTPPLLDLLMTASEYKGKLTKVAAEMSKLYKDEHSQLRQEANAIFHVLSHALSVVSAIRTKTEIPEDVLVAIERDVHIVALLSGRKCIVHGEVMMEKLLTELKLPDVGALRRHTGATQTLEQQGTD